ncbi:MAG: NUDIX hydrolase [bacterium]|nr:NUDIX hydrolase [bacterium]
MEFHITNYAILFNEKNEFLCIKYTNGDWAFPGGHLEHGESWELSVYREINEELGVTNNLVDLIAPLHIDNWEYENKYYYGSIVIGKIYTDSITLSDEHEKYRWLNLENYKTVRPVYNAYFEIVEKAYQYLNLLQLKH